MALATHSPTPPAALPKRPFTPDTGSYEAICAAAAVQYALEALLAQCRVSALTPQLLEERLNAARVRVDTATNAYVRGLEAC
jgi:hypothetical protein